MSVDLMEMWATMGWFAKMIVWLLLFMSLATFTVAFQRWWDLSKSKRQVVRFAPKLSAALEGHDLEAAERAVKEHEKGHLAAAYRGVFTALKEHVADRTLSAVEVGSIARTIDLNKLEQLARFRRGMGIMATVGATAPFVGLLGTTMGVVNAFTGMATAGSGGLAAISAGIAEALITHRLRLGGRHSGGVALQLFHGPSRAGEHGNRLRQQGVHELPARHREPALERAGSVQG